VLLCWPLQAVFFYSKLIGARMNVQADAEWLIIKTGDTYEDVLMTLTRNGWVENEDVFDFLAQQAKYPGKVKAGKYKIIKGGNVH
jgi:cell division protein YceG involved in septum cleavage